MKKLIELDAALDALREVIVPAEDIGFGDELTDGYNDGIDMAITVLSGLPTVDAVPVVRCKDCKHNPKLEWFGCPMASLSEKQRPETAWCWKGEREDGDDEKAD